VGCAPPQGLWLRAASLLLTNLRGSAASLLFPVARRSSA